MERKSAVTTLKLDAKNPRIPPEAGTLDTPSIIETLLRDENVLELAQQIADQGFFPTEVLVAVHEDGEEVVIEGNRRLAALKLLLNPALAPEKYRKRLTLLHGRVDAKRLRDVRVTFAPSREAAAPLIVSRHTREGTKRWLPLQQSRFVRSFARPDASLDELASTLGMDRGELAASLKNDAMYELARGLDLDPELATTVRNPRKFNTSTFVRLMESQPVQDMLGLSFDDQARPQISIKPEEFNKAFARIVSDVASDKQNTRTLNTNNDISSYLKTFGADEPDATPVAPYYPTTPSAVGDAEPVAEQTPKTPKSKATAGATSRPTASVLPRGLRCSLQAPRIVEVFDELRKLKVAQFPNASAVMLRILLELAASHYLDKTKKIKPMLATAKKNGKSSDWYPTLRQMMAELMKDPDITGELSPLAKKRLNKMISQNDHALSLDEIDNFVHNRYAFPSEAALRGFWLQLEDLMKILLVEPTPPPPPSRKP